MIRFTSLIVVAFLGIGVAHADSPHGVLAVGGNVETRDVQTVTGALTNALRAADWQLGSLTSPESTGLVECVGNTDLACGRKVFMAHGVERALIVRVEKQEGANNTLGFALKGKLIEADTDPVTSISDQRFCGPCTDDTLAQAAQGLAQSLLQQLALRSGRTLVAVTLDPPGAFVFIDGQRIDIVDVGGKTLKTSPGKHRIRAESDHLASDETTFVAKEGETVPVHLQLHPIGQSGSVKPTPSTNNGSSHRYLLPGVVTGVGAAAIVAGAILEATKTYPDPQPKYITSAPGITLMAVGAVVTGVGVWWLIHTHHKPPASMPTAVLTSGGGIVGWSGTF